MHHAIGFGLLIYLIAFVVGKPAARIIFGAVLLVAALAFTYIMFRVVAGTI